jgi:hypothetical protein
MNYMHLYNEFDESGYDVQTAMGGEGFEVANTPTLDAFRARNEATRKANVKGCHGKFRGRSCDRPVTFLYPVKQCNTCFPIEE